MVSSPFDGFSSASRSFFTVCREDLAGKEADSLLALCVIAAGYAGYSDRVVVDGTYGTGYMGSMTSGDYDGGVVNEIVASLVMCRQVFVLAVDASVRHSYDD